MDNLITDNLLPSEVKYQEQEFKKDMDKIREKVKTELQEGISQVNDGRINEQEYFKIKRGLIDEARAVRRRLLQERQAGIDEHIEAFDRKLIGLQGEDNSIIGRFREEYMKYQEQGKDELIKNYKLSKKLADEVSIKAIGYAAHEKGITEIISDYKKLNPEFFEVAEQQSNFIQRFYGAEERFNDMAGHYRGIDTYPEEKQPYQAGYTILNNGQQQPYYRNKLKLKY